MKYTICRTRSECPFWLSCKMQWGLSKYLRPSGLAYKCAKSPSFIYLSKQPDPLHFGSHFLVNLAHLYH
ncbi:hypothetical protein EMCG_05947 [[Emmonsia] crescens]|uniref:Uncharacterized protein n=1 Tax=[Emmonsia] crescens TaxID=73230 RepID=A0A0G2J7F1_9EURO|nr:hypothetical protein EMCG_05947 [Emmonsia crescens UAMH 3008]